MQEFCVLPLPPFPPPPPSRFPTSPLQDICRPTCCHSWQFAQLCEPNFLTLQPLVQKGQTSSFPQSPMINEARQYFSHVLVIVPEAYPSFWQNALTPFWLFQNQWPQMSSHLPLQKIHGRLSLSSLTSPLKHPSILLHVQSTHIHTHLRIFAQLNMCKNDSDAYLRYLLLIDLWLWQ